MRLWPFNRETVRLVAADEDGEDYGEAGLPPGARYGPNRAPPPEWIVRNESWAFDFSADLNRRNRFLVQRIWKAQQVNGQVWSVQKTTQKNHRFDAREVATFPDFPTVDQLKVKVLPEHGGGTYSVWATKPQPPAMVFQFILSETDLDAEAAQVVAKPAGKPADPFAAVDVAIAEHMANNPAAIEQLVAGVMEKRFGVKQPVKPADEKPEDPELQRFLDSHPEVADKIMAAKWAKNLGLKVKDLLPPAEGDDDDEFTKMLKALKRAKDFGKLLGYDSTAEAKDRGPGLFEPILEGLGKMLGNTDVAGVVKMLQKPSATPQQAQIQAPAVATQVAGATAAPEQPTPTPAAPVLEGEVMSAPADVPATPADGDSYKHLLPVSYTPDCKWAEYPPSATSKEALDKITALVDKDEAVQWLMSLDWAMLKRQLSLGVADFSQWLSEQAKAGDKGWLGLFNVLSRLHPHSMLLVLKHGLSIPIVRFSSAGEVCQMLLTEQGAAYLTFSMALCHEAHAKYGLGKAVGGSATGGDDEAVMPD